jgi:glycosyltransferase involved in cell wall biosynthesis
MEALRVQPDWKRRRKDGELALADRISVPSAYTRESLENAAVKVPITVTPFGFPVDSFAPKRSLEQRPFTVVAVGSHDLRKGTPYLLEAWKRAALPDARLVLVGIMRLTRAFVSSYAGIFEHVPHLPRALLGDVYRSADLLALPTLGDGCPLVVQEAMCCGTPVVTTRCGNGPEFITNDVDGWVLPERDVEALVALLRKVAADRNRLFRVGQAARARAERWTWQDAGRALVQAFRPS